MSRVGVLSDTHLRTRAPVIPESVMQGLRDVDLILHAGDICCTETLDLLRSIAPVIAVYGNVDPPELQSTLSADAVVDCDGVLVGLTHGHLGASRTTPGRAIERFIAQPDVRLIVFGHSHVPGITRYGDLLLFNPGSPTQPRMQPRPTFGILEITASSTKPSLVYLAE
jgi:uncharacterized protein